MKNFLKQYFTFNNRERNGIIVLLAIIVLLIISIQLVPYIIKQPTVDFNYLNEHVKQLQQTSVKDTSDELALSSLEIEMNNSPASEKKEQLFNFNPNSATTDELKQLGFSEKLIHTLINYRNKGGRFHKKEDLKKVYGIKENFYQAIESYIVFDSVKQAAPLHSDNYREEKSLSDEMELNSADSISLVKLRGIGPSFAHRIIAYRNKLGGFYKMEQLKEVYGLDSSMYALVSSQLDINDQQLTTININTATVDELKRHPYIKYNFANLIVNYRTQHGLYKDVDDIKKLRLVSDELYLKLAPYLTTK